MIILGHHCVTILFGENANLGTFLTIDVNFLNLFIFLLSKLFIALLFDMV